MATVVVATVCAVFVSLGQWQLNRHSERALENVVMSTRISSQPAELSLLIAAAGDDIGTLDFRPVVVTGEFVPDQEIFVRSQVANDRSGFHVVTPLLTEAGTVLVNRGWVPLAAEAPPVTAVPPPAGTVTVNGLARASQTRPSIGPTEPEGKLSIVARIDLERLSEQLDNLVPVWIQQTDPSPDALPVRVAPPDVTDPGPHLPYAFQWFSFAIIAAVGYGFVIRKALPR
jgi:cytochrome oxidase assembly protein ShyY1